MQIVANCNELRVTEFSGNRVAQLKRQRQLLIEAGFVRRDIGINREGCAALTNGRTSC